MTLALEAMAALMAGAVAVRLLPFRVIAGRLGRPLVAPAPGGDADADRRRVAWAVRAAAARAPWPVKCFEEGLAAHAMLRRRGRAAVLYYGVKPNGSRAPLAHVWVRLGCDDVVGCELAAAYAVLATFPSSPGEGQGPGKARG